MNINTERSQLTQRITGYGLSLFAVFTVVHFKLVVFLSMDSSQYVPVAAWDSPTGAALGHPAFAPVTSWSQNVSIPANPVFVGVAIGWQSITFSPNTTAAGIISSNGLVTLLAAQ